MLLFFFYPARAQPTTTTKVLMGCCSKFVSTGVAGSRLSFLYTCITIIEFSLSRHSFNISFYYTSLEKMERESSKSWAGEFSVMKGRCCCLVYILYKPEGLYRIYRRSINQSSACVSPSFLLARYTRNALVVYRPRADIHIGARVTQRGEAVVPVGYKRQKGSKHRG